MPLCLVFFIVCLPPLLPCAILGATWQLFPRSPWRCLLHAHLPQLPLSALCALLTRLSHINSCSCFGLRRISDAHILLSYKYDKPAMREYASDCTLKSLRNGRFFCTRRNNFFYAYKNIFLREAEVFSSRTIFDFLAKRTILCGMNLR